MPSFGLLAVSSLWLAACIALPIAGAFEASETFLIYYSNFIQIGGALFGAVLCYRTVFIFEADDTMRKVWLFLGSGVLAWGLGAVLYFSYQLANNGAEPPYPWFSDIGYLLMVPLIVISLVIFKRALRVPAPTWGIAAGIIMFAAALGIALWSGKGNLGQADSLLAAVVQIAYMLLDPLLLGMTMYSASLLAGGLAALPWWFGLGGLVLYYIGNISFDFLLARDQYATGSIVDTTWPLAFGLIAVAAMLTYNMFKALEET